MLDKELLGHRLRMQQITLQLSVTAAAKEIGISKSTLSRLNREKIVPDVETYYKCCIWLKQNLEYFFNTK